jgi:Arc/MetJ family transcription regulator
LLNISTTESSMATVNFSVPDDVKAAFDKMFGAQNKSGIVADLMRRAVREATQQQRREQLFRKLTGARAGRPTASSAQLRAARAAGRP